MSSKAVCHFNKFGYCKFGKSCFRYHEDKVCKNSSCKVVECGLRHPKRCRFFSDYSYCKFGTYCKFSHEKQEGNGKLVEVLEKEIDDLKKAIDKKETELRKIDQDIIKVDEKIKMEMAIIHHKNEALGKELKDVVIELEEVKKENLTLKSRFDIMEAEIRSLKGVSKLPNNSQSEGIEEEVVTYTAGQENEISNHVCDRCEFVGKSEAGLKTHKTVKHNGSLFRAYRKVSK